MRALLSALSRWLDVRRVRRLREKVRRNREMVAAFTASREPLTDAEFVAGCLPAATPEQARWCLAVRWGVARYGRVGPGYIRPEDCPVDLAGLPGWRDSDPIYQNPVWFMMLVEMAAGHRFTDREAERLHSPFNDERMPVAEFARRVATAGQPRQLRHDRTNP